MVLKNKYFRDIAFPSTFKYSSDSNHIPLEFYEETFPVASQIDLLLGYFSSNAFKVLARSFSEFIMNGGSMRIITNHVYSLRDKENLIDELSLKNEDKVIDIFADADKLENELRDYGLHFFDCLRYLLKHKRLQIMPVKFNGVDLAHSKKMILYDGKDYISTDGSINFTLNSLTRNSESFEVNAPWKGEIFDRRTKEEIENFELIFSHQHSSYQYISPEYIEVVINKIGKPKELHDLLEDSIRLDNSEFGLKVKELLTRKKIRFQTILEKEDENEAPSFPYSSGPRSYQIDAYSNWLDNNFKGVFAMATGTGKTITSLNCVLQEYQISGKYHAIVLVPSVALVDQWEEEISEFKFNKILKVNSSYNWESQLASFTSNFKWGLQENIFIVSTYGSFITDRFQKYFSKIAKDFIFIADEAHNIGADQIKRVLPKISCEKRIGLSATPKRIYDPEGTEALNNFFNDSPPYTYNFDMERALNEGFLTEYKYFPVLVELTEGEMDEYIDISKKLLRYFDPESESFKDDPIVEKLLIRRKNVIHKANNKVECFKTILKDLESMKKLKYIFTYVPEGYIYNDSNTGTKILHEFLKAGAETVPTLKMNSYTSEDEDLPGILNGFESGKINLLFAMKMLDEGVDVPRAEVGIFCSSTGNPRQFIQRRGRLLRKHVDKAYATIYDMVVIPTSNNNNDYFSMEQNMVRNELRRVAYFSSLSMNYYDSRENLESVCNKYELNLDEIIAEL